MRLFWWTRVCRSRGQGEGTSRKMATGFGSLLRECPLLLPQNREKSVYEGFVTAQGRDFHIRILLPMDGQLKNAGIQCSWYLKKLLHGYHLILKQRLEHSSDLVSFMVELKTILELALKNTEELCAQPPPQYYSGLIGDIENLGWNKVLFIDPAFSTIRLKAEDSSGRDHQITLKLNSKYPREQPDCLIDLPIQFSFSWTPQSSLLSIHSQFLAALESLKEFWDVLDEIDEKTWVLEPEKPTRSSTRRRIAIGSNISLNIEIDPRHPTMLPECYFLGADHVVNPLKIKLNSNIHMWNPENSLLKNLKEILEVDFPSREALEKSDFSMDCGICYAYRLDGTIPDQVCDDSHCGQSFHQVCLYEWLRGLPSSRQSFNVIFGECPYCSKQITLKISTKKI
uniref:E3 ubiquitin-protein ligase FANCL n=1 Tax=Naja naja TaxID=35670 RepID=A0A8C6VKW1_NAJNA